MLNPFRPASTKGVIAALALIGGLYGAPGSAATSPDEQPAAATAESKPVQPGCMAPCIHKEYDEKSGSTHYSEELGKGSKEPTSLQAWQFRESSLSFGIHVVLRTADDWGRINSAYDADGNRFYTAFIVTDMWSCSPAPCNDIYIEQLGVDISEEYLEEKQDTGIEIKLVGRDREFPITIAPERIKAMLEAVRG